MKATFADRNCQWLDLRRNLFCSVGAATCEGQKQSVKPTAGASFARGSGGSDDNSSPRYCTSTLMVWVAVRRA